MRRMSPGDIIALDFNVGAGSKFEAMLLESTSSSGELKTKGWINGEDTLLLISAALGEHNYNFVLTRLGLGWISRKLCRVLDDCWALADQTTCHNPEPTNTSLAEP